MDSDGYPLEETLTKIEQWDVSGDGKCKELLDFVETVWWMPSWGWKEDDGHYSISTGGGSGDEDLITALQKNFLFWSLCWQASERGGHFLFELSNVT